MKLLLSRRAVTNWMVLQETVVSILSDKILLHLLGGKWNIQRWYFINLFQNYSNMFYFFSITYTEVIIKNKLNLSWFTHFCFISIFHNDWLTTVWLVSTFNNWCFEILLSSRTLVKQEKSKDIFCKNDILNFICYIYVYVRIKNVLDPVNEKLDKSTIVFLFNKFVNNGVQAFDIKDFAERFLKETVEKQIKYCDVISEDERYRQFAEKLKERCKFV